MAKVAVYHIQIRHYSPLPSPRWETFYHVTFYLNINVFTSLQTLIQVVCDILSLLGSYCVGTSQLINTNVNYKGSDMVRLHFKFLLAYWLNFTKFKVISRK